jgi:hypothetical protein
MIARFLCHILGHRWYTLWTAGAGDIWGEGCYRCDREVPANEVKEVKDD